MSDSMPSAIQSMLDEASEEVLATISNTKEAGRQPAGNHVARLDCKAAKTFQYGIDGQRDKFPGIIFPWVIEETDNPSINTDNNPVVRDRVKVGPYKDKKGKLVLESIDLQPYKSIYRQVVGEPAPEDAKEFISKFFEVCDGVRVNLAVQDDKKNAQYQRIYINGVVDND